MLKNFAIFALFVLLLTAAGCETVKGIGGSLAYTVQGIGDDTVGLWRSATGKEKMEGSYTVEESKKGFACITQGIKKDYENIFGRMSISDDWMKKNLW